MPFRYNRNDNEFILNVSSQSCNCDDVVFGKNAEYNFDVEFKYRAKKIMATHVYYKT